MRILRVNPSNEQIYHIQTNDKRNEIRSTYLSVGEVFEENEIAIVNAAQLCRATIENCRVRMMNVLINFGRQLFIIVAMAVEAGLEM